MNKQHTKLTCIIVLNWNGIEDTRNCLLSLSQIDKGNYIIILVDNGSKNNEADTLQKEFKNILVLKLEKNFGFSGGMNRGINFAKQFSPDYFLLLNNDTEVEPNFLIELTKALERNPKYGIASPVIYDMNDKTNIQFSGGKINWLMGRTYHLVDSHSEIREEPFVTGCSMIIKAELLDRLNGFDDRFFAYFEDNALCLSAAKLGYACISVPASKIYHHLSASSDKKGAFYTYLLSRNRILFVNNYLPIFYRCYFFLYNFVKLCGATIYFISVGQKKRAQAFVIGYVDGYRNRGGSPTL